MTFLVSDLSTKNRFSGIMILLPECGVSAISLMFKLASVGR